MENNFLRETGFDKIRKCILFFVGFCFGASVSYIRFDVAMSYFAAFCGIVFFVFERNLKKESKIRAWNNKRFVYMAGFPIFFMLIGFVILGLYRGDRQLVIAMSIGAIIILISTFINAKLMVKENDSFKK